MATWAPALLVVLLLPSCLLPSAVHCVPVSSSEEVVRNFSCSNPDLQHLVFPAPCPDKTKTLYIQGFVPATNPVYTSETVIPAAYMAIDDVNANCSMIRGYKLQLDWVNTLCDPSEATWQLIDSLVLQRNDSNPLTKITFLGGGCSLATEPVAALSGRFYVIPQISYGAASPSLSQENLFPRFMRTNPSEVQSNKARFSLMRMYNWRRVATLHETQTIFSLTVEDFNGRYDILYNKSSDSGSDDPEEDHVLRSFTDDPEIPLKQIMEKDIRIIFGFFYEDKATDTICLAYHMNLTSANHLWILPAWYTIGWWDVDVNLTNVACTKQQMREAINNALFVDSYNFGENEDETTDTPTESASVFRDKFQCYLEEFRANPMSGSITNGSEGTTYDSFTYDAVWTTALGLDETDRALERRREEEPGFNLTLDDFEYFNKTPVSVMISDFMLNVSFTGVSGDVRFDENGTRAGLNGVYQLRENLTSDTLDLVLLAIHDPGVESASRGDFNQNLSFMVAPLWKGDGPPSDRRTPRNIYMNQQLVYVCYFITTVAIVVGIALLVFNLVTMFKPLIRDSAPHINTIIIIGCIWILTTCYLLSVDSANPPIDEFVDDPSYSETVDVAEIRNHRYENICTLRLWFLTIGFTLSFGALFAKTWQVYRVYTNPKLQKEPFKMWNFFIIMGVFLVIDFAYLIFWTAVYPFRRNLEMQTDSSADIERIHEECECDNYAYLIGALYVYKGLLVVFGLFLAYESRNVKYYYINDSRFVSIAMYIVVILVGIGAPLSLVLAVHFFTDAAYGLAVFMVIASALSCMLIIFVPKFVFMAHGKDTMVRENEREEITVSDGLQLGHTTVDQADVNTVEGEVDKLKQQNEKKDLELRELQSEIVSESDLGGLKPRTGSDGDSGVLVTVDENDVFSTESTANGEAHRSAVNTPSSGVGDNSPPEATSA